MRPRARKDVSLQEVGTEGLLYDREAGMVHILNRTALFAWKQCDGSLTAEEIAAAMRGRFEVDAQVDIARDVLHILAGFADKGLLEGS
ncbi:MAG TPA: PqqD family protein [Candidatus Saccharimonadales bacterium]|nr:PqqD family protein [Candidatus Saccharimonadales bacterium]